MSSRGPIPGPRPGLSSTTSFHSKSISPGSLNLPSVLSLICYSAKAGVALDRSATKRNIFPVILVQSSPSSPNESGNLTFFLPPISFSLHFPRSPWPFKKSKAIQGSPLNTNWNFFSFLTSSYHLVWSLSKRKHRVERIQLQEQFSRQLWIPGRIS